MFCVHLWFDCVCATWMTDQQNSINVAISLTIREQYQKMIPLSLCQNTSFSSHQTTRLNGVGESKTVRPISHHILNSNAFPDSRCGGCHTLISCSCYGVTNVSIRYPEGWLWAFPDSPFRLPHLIVW